MIYYFLIFAFFLWISGYLMTSLFLSTVGVHGKDQEKFIIPPKWLYILCGAPVSKKFPQGTMRVVAFRTQMAGICLGLGILCNVIIRPRSTLFVLILGCFMLISYWVTAYISKHYVAKNQDGIRWRHTLKNRVGLRNRKK